MESNYTRERDEITERHDARIRRANRTLLPAVGLAALVSLGSFMVPDVIGQMDHPGILRGREVSYSSYKKQENIREYLGVGGFVVAFGLAVGYDLFRRRSTKIMREELGSLTDSQ